VTGAGSQAITRSVFRVRRIQVKIAFTTSGSDLNGPLDMRFGRAPRFLVYDLDRDTFEVLENQQNLHAAQGAGIQSAETVIRAGAEILVTGHCGPKAFKVLASAGIEVYNCGASTVKESLELFRQGSLGAAVEADVDGHWE